MRSIRSQLTSALLLGQVALVGAMDTGVWWLGARSLTETFDARLDERVRTLATLVRQEGPYVDLEFSEDLMPGYSRTEDPEFFQVWIAGHGVLERSDTLLVRDVPDGERAQLAEPDIVPGVVVHADTALPDGRPGRQAALLGPIHEYEPEAENGKVASQQSAAVVVAVSRGPLDGQLRALALGLLGVTAVLLLGSALLIRRTLRRGLAPIGAFAERVSRIQAPHERADLAALDPPLEIAPVSGSVDRMLVRLGEAFDRERRLSGNIAHELRTPVAELHTAMDVALRAPGDVEGLVRAAREGRDIAGEMDRTIGALLRLWRREQDAGLALGRASVGAVLDAALGSARELSSARDVEFEGACEDPDVEVQVAERPLALVVGNLVQNAASHASSGSVVEWSAGREGERAFVRVANDHAGDVDAGRALEPFFTTGRERDHAGLGLSLARALCDASGMELELDVTPTRFVARLSAPLAG